MKSVVFTVADNNNLPYAKMLESSVKKFHPDVDFVLFSEEDVMQLPFSEPFYRCKAYFGKKLSETYDCVVNIDADSIVVGSLQDIFDCPYEVGSVLNNAIHVPDPLERQIVTLDRTNPLYYVNAGLVAAKSKRFWNWWNNLNQRHFYDKYQFREQDTLNMIYFYGDLHCVNFDDGANVYGLWLNGYWPQAVIENDEIVLPKEVLGVKKPLKVLHWAGGSNAKKMNYRTRFSEKVADRIADLIS